MKVLHFLRERVIDFEAQVHLENARLDLETVQVKAYFDRLTGKFVDLRIFLYGCEYTEYLTSGQFQDLQSEAIGEYENRLL